MFKANKFRGSEDLAYLGGLFKETLLDNLEEKYPSAVVDIVSNNCKLDRSIWDICDETYRTYIAITTPNNSLYSEYDVMNKENEITPFGIWLLTQTCRCKKEKIDLNSHGFLSNLELSRMEQKTIEQLTAIEEKVLGYSWGIDGEERKNAEEIASLPEFLCDHEWIKRVIESAEDTLDGTKIYEKYTQREDVIRKEKECNE